MRLTKNEKNAVLNEVKVLNEKSGLKLSGDVMVRIVSSYDGTDNMSKRMIKYVGGVAAKALKKGTITDVTLLGVHYSEFLENVGKNTSLGEIRTVANESDEAHEGFLESVFGKKNRFMFEYDKKAIELGAELEKNGVSEGLKTKYEHEINTKLSDTVNFIYDVKNGNETKYNSMNLRNDLKAIAPSYMAASRLYNEKSIFGKWFTPSGWFLRGAMKTVEESLEKANTLLGNRTSLKAEDIPSLLKASASASDQAVDTGLKDAFLTAENRRVMIEINTLEKEENIDALLEVKPVMEEERDLSFDEEDVSLAY